MNDHTHIVWQWVAIAALAVLLLSGMASVWALQSQIVGKTPEGFHRVDATELMEALCLMNDGLRCPDPYHLPRFERQLSIEEAKP